jgi:hypothetical protein
MTRLFWATALALVAACGGSDPKPVDPAVPAADPAPCADVATHAMALLGKEMATDAIHEVVVRHCRDDQWSVELRTCMLLAKTQAELEPCQAKFVGTQHESLHKDLDALATGPTVPAGQNVPAVPNAAPPPDVPPAANTMPK